MDVTGANVFDVRDKQFHFRPGPIFTHILLADEINRATPKTQSALLEVMEERSCTVDGVTHKLEEPFQVLATMNPIEHQGTYPLPAAQIDRFMVMLEIGYPSPEDEVKVLDYHLSSESGRWVMATGWRIGSLFVPSFVAVLVAVRATNTQVHVAGYVLAGLWILMACALWMRYRQARRADPSPINAASWPQLDVLSA